MEITNSFTNNTDQENLIRAWSLIISTRLQEAANIAETSGPGVMVYKFLPSEEKVQDLDNEEVANCQAIFAPREKKQVWETFFGQVPYKDAIIEKYNPEEHILISVHVPAADNQDNTVGTVRLFSKSTLEPL
jgi:hypothetical protein